VVTTILHLSQDELSIILNYLPVSGKLMLSCISSSMYQCIDKLVREQFVVYDTSVPLSTIWRKYENYRLTPSKYENCIDDLKNLLKKGYGVSFSNVTQKLKVTLENDGYRNDDNTQRTEFEPLIDLLTMPTAENTTKIVGHTLKKCAINTHTFKFKLLNYVCNVQHLEISSLNWNYNKRIRENAVKLNQLNKIVISGSELSKNESNHLASLIPNVRIFMMPNHSAFSLSFVDNCPHLTDIFLDCETYGVSVSDKCVLYMVEHLAELKRLDITTNSFTGSALNKLGLYVKNLEYLRIVRQGYESMELEPTAQIGGGKIYSLKEFIFGRGFDKADDDQYDLEKIFHSVIEYCPNISYIRLEETNSYRDAYPSNLFGLVPIQNIKEVVWYPDISEVQNIKHTLFRKIFKEFTVPGKSVIDTIRKKEDDWQAIAQSTTVNIVKMYKIPPIDVLKVCYWQNAHTLILYDDTSELMNAEQFQCLVNTCPNIRSLEGIGYINRKLLRQVLSSNILWPHLTELGSNIGQDGAILKARPYMNKYMDCKKPSWESKWLSQD
jgi:hypothetical protein